MSEPLFGCNDQNMLLAVTTISMDMYGFQSIHITIYVNLISFGTCECERAEEPVRLGVFQQNCHALSSVACPRNVLVPK